MFRFFPVNNSFVQLGLSTINLHPLSGFANLHIHVNAVMADFEYKAGATWNGILPGVVNMLDHCCIV